MEKKQNLNVNFTGDEYMRYMQDKRENSFMKKFDNLNNSSKFSLSIIGITIIVSTLILIIVDMLQPTTRVVVNWEGVLAFLAICAGFSWLLHGFGFILVRR